MENDFIQHISHLKPSMHVFGDQRGSEENAKIKFVIPLLEYLGYDVIDNLYFEVKRLDILVRNQQTNLLIIECKAWEEFLENHRNQYLEYMYRLKLPYLLATSGEQTVLYSGLLSPEDFSKTIPIIKFSFDEITYNPNFFINLLFIY